MPNAQVRDENGVTLFDVEYGPGPYAASQPRPQPYALMVNGNLYVWHPRFSQYRAVPQTTTRVVRDWSVTPQTLPAPPPEEP